MFEEALISNGKNAIIPEEDNFFGKLVGDWEFDWIDNNNSRTVKGEWSFAWILEGRAIQDVCILPSRATRFENHQPDGEYGTTLRIYNPHIKVWDIVYCWTDNIPNTEKVIRLVAKKESSKIVLTNISDPNKKWVFSEICENTFHWQNITVRNDDSWHINADLYAKRKNICSKI